MNNNLKGQFSIVAIIGVFLSILLFSVLYPIIKTFIDNVAPELDPVSAQILYLIPTFTLIGIIMSIFFYATGGGSQQQG